MTDYVELHANSAFSFLRGASLPEALAKRAATIELPALAVLDRDGVFGAPRLYGAGREAGVRPIVGAEITMEDGSVVPLLVMNAAGYRNLCRLISTAKLEERPAGIMAGVKPAPQSSSDDPRARKRACFATWRELAEHAEGLIALTGDEEGPVVRAWEAGGAAAAGAAAEKLERIFGKDRLYVEVQRRRVRGENATVRMLAELAATRGLRLVATGGVRHATADERIVADVFTCLRHHTTLDAAGRRLAPNSERHLRTARTMRELFSDLPDAVAESVRLAERLEFTLKNLGYEFPDFPVGPGETMAGVLREQVYAGARERFGTITQTITTQIEKELALINKLGFAGYFLIVWDICRWAREHGVLVQGRGSAANSVVCYVLRITSVDPIAGRLLFERFLSEGRVGVDGHPSWPDVDLDLPSGDLRESVIQEVYRRYAPRGAAMVANVITYRGRSVVRELGKVMGLSTDVMDRFSALYANGDFPQTLDIADQVRLAGLPAKHPRLPAVLAAYHRMKGLPRHLGQHSGGMVLCPNRLDTVVPIEPAAMEGRCVVQWDKDDCEDLGLVKIDFLGLGMMAVLQDTLALCRERGGPAELAAIPQNDAKTYERMQAADTVGVFQIESRAQMATLPRLRPKCFYDVAMQVAIVRPGPIVGRLAHPLIRRRQGLEKVEFIDPSVEAIVRPTLERTMGVILFQEQMLKIAMDLADFTGAEAEELRRAMGFTRSSDRLEKAFEKLRAALRAKGRNETVVRKVVESCASFAAYGFPESHAISFALLAYASTWLKAHRPAEFCASLLNNQPMGFYSPATLIQDARRHGLKVRPVCVAASEWESTVEAPDAIRIGLRQVKGVHEARVRAMLAARRERAFASLGDFLARTKFVAAERRALAAVGALQALAEHRRAALWQIEAAWSAEEALLQKLPNGRGDVSAAPRVTAQPTPAAGGTCHTLYDKDECHIMYDKGEPPRRGTSGEAGPASGRRGEVAGGDAGGVPLARMTRVERMRADFAGLNLTTGVHPMTLVRARLPEAWRAADLPLGRDGDRVQIAGSVICRQRPGTAKGFVFISLEDETGIANAVVEPDLFERRRMTINEEPALRIGGRLQIQQGVIHVRAETIEALRLEEVPAQASHDFR
ncbi:MAG TPA: error-prone DNA polymerase [Opitutus sp.]|nr:error-prone DNA polymerase [Opitutus sp.]